uniref:Adenylate/guanylate cyclase domain-containing protein n=1 Tax=candidate division WOR-3 bacterium TaxID=2052148 RepID=A0A7C4YQX3_UNCW3
MIKKLIYSFIVFILSFILSFTGPLRFLELKLIDSRFRVRGIKPAPEDIVIVEIDETTYKALGIRFPYPRDYYAKFLRNLKKAGARVVGIDIEFDIEDYFLEKDSIFSDAICDFKNVVLASKIVDNGIVEPNPVIGKCAHTGFVNTILDFDGFLRRYLYRSKRGYKSFGLKVAEVLGKEFDISGSRYLYYYGPSRTFTYVPFYRVLDDEEFFVPGIEDSANDVNIFNELLNEGVFKDKIVLLGVTLEEFRDFVYTPFFSGKGLTPGVEIHATAIGNLLKNESVKVFNNLFLWLILFVLTILLFLFPYSKPLRTSIIFIIFLIIIISLNFYLFIRFNTIIKLIPEILVITITYIVGTTDSIFVSQRERRYIKNVFQKYVPGVILEEIVKNPKGIELGGEEKVLTVMFTDIEGFTSFSEGKEPRVVVNLINQYLSSMTKIIFKHKGTVDKYEGDAIMSIFGAPYYFDEHPLEAVLSALEMKDEIKKMWENGFPKLKTRFGINTGKMIVGNLGTEERMDYTVIGDSVNLASRLEGANKFYGTTILISESTAQYVRDKIPLREIDKIRVKGKVEPVTIYEPLGFEWNDALRIYIEKYENALKYYRERKWEEAEKVFFEIYNFSKDRVAGIFLDRINIFKRNPPPDDWDGVFTFTEK